jgi:hypothetical protein
MVGAQGMARHAMVGDRRMTRHATVRSQQRAVPPLVMSLLLEFGSIMRHEGAEVVYVDKRARRRLRDAVGGDRSLAVVERWLNTYVVTGEDGCVMTVARRTKRLQRP